MRKRRLHGFTLIELLITVAIVAVLARIAYPSYLGHVQKGARRSAQAQMMDLANREQQYLLANRAYASKATLESAGYSFPTELSGRYTWNVSCTSGGAAIACDTAPSGAPGFTISFTGINSQANDGNLSLTSEGAKSPSDKW
jgi:type IV pilus assembly protein PilE